ncbi:hypothetical protein Avbf_18033 [Armadillidium vulgare]|nr:hypothetical protein Avbf_18033 [Armadillidium vulgare]
MDGQSSGCTLELLHRRLSTSLTGVSRNSWVPGVDSNLRINSTSHCVFSDATKLNLVEGVFEKYYGGQS